MAEIVSAISKKGNNINGNENGNENAGEIDENTGAEKRRQRSGSA
jgi:hypothetical protein